MFTGPLVQIKLRLVSSVLLCIIRVILQCATSPQMHTQPHEISVHDWVVQCLLNHIKEWLKTFIRRPSLEDFFSFINIWHTNSIQGLNLHDFLCRFWFHPSIHILEIYLKNGLGTGRFLSETGSLWEQSKQKLKKKQTAVVPKKRSSISNRS